MYSNPVKASIVLDKAVEYLLRSARILSNYIDLLLVVLPKTGVDLRITDLILYFSG